MNRPTPQQSLAIPKRSTTRNVLKVISTQQNNKEFSSTKSHLIDRNSVLVTFFSIPSVLLHNFVDTRSGIVQLSVGLLAARKGQCFWLACQSHQTKILRYLIFSSRV